MPAYFAYGANLDMAAMAARCPDATPIGAGRLMDHRFIIMPDGVASVRRERGQVVHGLLWSLPLRDLKPLDEFEEVEAGLYTRVTMPVLKPVGAVQAFVYVGHSAEEGRPLPGYLDVVIAAARQAGLPDAYVGSIADWGRNGTAGHAFDNGANTGRRPSGPVPGVTPRFATPFDLKKARVPRR